MNNLMDGLAFAGLIVIPLMIIIGIVAAIIRFGEAAVISLILIGAIVSVLILSERRRGKS